MRAITLWQPWASLVAIGAKQWETRSWPAEFRGWLAIHAARSTDYSETARRTPFLESLGRAGITPKDLPFGKVVALAYLADCIPSELAKPGDMERAFGNYDPGRWIWQFREVARIEPAIVARGARKIWAWDENAAGVAVPSLFAV